MNTESRNEIAEGLRYVHFRADANTSKLVEIASFMYAAIDLLADKLDRQVVKHKEKVTDHHRGDTAARTASFG